jgi:hypothetical protein
VSDRRQEGVGVAGIETQIRDGVRKTKLCPNHQTYNLELALAAAWVQMRLLNDE